MQYEYVNESEVPVKITITYRELVLLEKLLSKEEGDWRYSDMRKAVKEAIRHVTDAMNCHYQYEQHKLEQEDTDNA